MDKESMVSLLFFVIYTPFSIISWHKTSGNLFDLFIILGIGAVIIFIYLLLSLICHKIKQFLKRRKKISEDVEIKAWYVEESEEEDSFAGFRKLFSENKQEGGEKQ